MTARSLLCVGCWKPRLLPTAGVIGMMCAAAVRGGVLQESVAAVPDVEEVCERVLAARRAMKTGIVTFERTITDRNDPDYMWKTQTLHVEAWFTEDQRRFNFKIEGVPKTQPGRVLKNDWQIIYGLDGPIGAALRDERRGKSKPNTELIVRTPEAVRMGMRQNGRVRAHDWDIRGLGLTMAGLYQTPDLDEVFQLVHEGSPQVAVTENGQIELSVTVQRQSGQLHGLWRIDPKQNDSVVFTSISDSFGRTEAKVFNTEWNDGHWFPKEIELQEFQDDRLHYRSVLTVLNARFNVPVSGELFELTSLDLEPNMAASLDGQMKTWDGEKLIDIGVPQPTEDVRVAEKQRQRRRLTSVLLLNAGLATLVGLFFLVRWYRRSKTA